jgi:hypothetical protein
MFLRLRITGAFPLHGRYPGEEFYVRCDGSERPVNALWSKRLADEAIHRTGFVSVLGRVVALPAGASAVDDAAEPSNIDTPPPTPVPAPIQPPSTPATPSEGTDQIERRILASVVRLLADHRSEVMRAVTAEISKSVTSHVNAAVNASVNDAVRQLSADVQELNLKMALTADAWRVRINLPPNWHSGAHVDISAPPLIQAYADLHHAGNVGDAAMALTDADDKWQSGTADQMRLRGNMSTMN